MACIVLERQDIEQRLHRGERLQQMGFSIPKASRKQGMASVL